MKKHFNDAEEQYKYELSRLKKQLEEKSSYDSTSHTRQDRQNKEKEHEISRLEGNIQKMR